MKNLIDSHPPPFWNPPPTQKINCQIINVRHSRKQGLDFCIFGLLSRDKLICIGGPPCSCSHVAVVFPDCRALFHSSPNAPNLTFNGFQCSGALGSGREKMQMIALPLARISRIGAEPNGPECKQVDRLLLCCSPSPPSSASAGVTA